MLRGLSIVSSSRCGLHSCNFLAKATKNQARLVNNELLVNSEKRIILKRKSSTISSNNPLPSSTFHNELKLSNLITRSKSTCAKKSRRKKSSLSTTASSQPQQQSILDRISTALLYPRVLPLPRWISPRQTSVTLSEVFGHGSFILITISYAMDDFLMLRIIAVLGSTFMLFFTYFHPHGRVLWLPFKWNFLFIIINLYRILKVYQEERLGDSLSKDLLALNRDYMSLLSTSDFAKMVQIGTMETFTKNDVIVDQGDMNIYVRLVISGTVDVLRDNSLNYHIYRGDFISESGLHAGLYLDGSVESCAKLIASSDNVTCIRWKRDELMKLLRKERTLAISLKSVLSWDIIHKLKTQREVIINHDVADIDKWTLKRKEQSDHRYRAILHNILSHHGQLDGHKSELNNYRTIHNINDERHFQALKTCGWTPEEYELGHKVIEDDHGDNNFFIHLLDLMKSSSSKLFPN